jgi:hypothetical protein
MAPLGEVRAFGGGDNIKRNFRETSFENMNSIHLAKYNVNVVDFSEHGYEPSASTNV